MKKRNKTFRSGVKCFTGYLLGNMFALLLSLGFSGCSGEGNGLEEAFPADDDASLLASQWENIRTRSSSAGIVILVTTADTVSFEVEKTSDIIVDWGDGNMEISNFSHIYTDNAPVHTITFNAPAAALTELECSRQELIFLDVTRATALKELNCEFNRLTQLDVSSNSGLERLYYSRNRFIGEGVDVSGNQELKVLFCYGNAITHLDISRNPLLEVFSCWENRLKELDVSAAVKLKDLACGNNLLTVLDVSHNPGLNSLHCENNLLSVMDLTSNIKLTSFNSDENPLTEIDVSLNVNLNNISCENNRLEVLMLPQCPNLASVSVKGNPLVHYVQRIMWVVDALPDRTGMGMLGFGILTLGLDEIDTRIRSSCNAKFWAII